MSKANVLIGVAVVAGAVLLAAPLRSPAQGNQAAGAKWEYQIVTDHSNAPDLRRLTAKGNEGWELVHVEGSFPIAEAGATNYTARFYYFKRPK